MRTNETLTVWDPAEHLDDDEAKALYLEAAFAENDTALIAAALGDIARAQGMSDIARKTGLARESLYRSLSPGGNPEMGTILKVMDALGLKIRVSA
jgi:probable addiction module antidote protein